MEQSCVAISVECDLSFLHMKQYWLMAWQSLFLIKQTVSFHSATFHSPPNKTLFCLAVQLLFYSSVFLAYIFNFQNVFPISAFPFDLCGCLQLSVLNYSFNLVNLLLVCLVPCPEQKRLIVFVDDTELRSAVDFLEGQEVF